MARLDEDDSLGDACKLWAPKQVEHSPLATAKRTCMREDVNHVHWSLGADDADVCAGGGRIGSRHDGTS
jgi:hypothetical protein